MPQYLAPGVYVEEELSAVKPIAGVGTSTAGFIGTVANNVTMPFRPGRPVNPQNPASDDFYPVAKPNQPQLVTSWEGFKNTFGDIQAGNTTLAHAVYGFFNNGGTRCWITRVIGGADAGETTGSLIAALDTFKPIDEIALVAIPGVTDDAVQNAILDHCENPYLQDRFAILDGRRTETLTKTAIQGGVRDSDYGAIYFPWIEAFDPVTSPVTRMNIVIPPSGHIAGVYARVDAERGVHKAPANEVIRGALGVETLRQQGGPGRPEPGGYQRHPQVRRQHHHLGGAHLAGKEKAEWKYINVRRLFLFLRESIDQGTQWVVFEPNDPSLWAQITRNVTAFLTNVWRSGALFGATPAGSLLREVRCRDQPAGGARAGEVVTEIGVAVVKPAEFVIFRISQWAGPSQ